MAGMKTGQWHTIGYLDPQSYVADCKSDGFWKEVYSSGRLIILRNAESGYFNVLVDDRKGDDKWKLMIPANVTTLRWWLNERYHMPEYTKEILRNK